MKRRDFLKVMGLGAAAIGVRRMMWATKPQRRPNILFIMADDLGKEWISCYGAEDIRTPNTDALAEGGMRFENAYSMPQCTPSRATLLTGQYPWRNGWVNHWDVPRWGVGYFDWNQRQNMTFARLMKRAGYATAAAGKWQINDFRIAPDAMKEHGFDDWCMWTGFETGNPASAKRYWDPYINTPQGSKIYEGKFGPDMYADFLVGFIRKNKDKPMMLYFPMALTHGPLTTTPVEPDVQSNTDKHKAMVRYADHLVGRLVKTLDEAGIRDRTIVIFTTDNGSGGRLIGTRHGRKIHGGKSKKTENGVCAPFVVNCPGMVPKGVVTDALTDFTDLLPTFAELGGATIPPDLKINGVSIAPLLLGKAKDSPRDWIMALGHGAARLDERGVRGKADFASRVIRDKRFKVLVDERREIVELYDLKSDPFEESNLVASTEQEHLAALQKFQAVVAAMPEKDARPKYSPRKSNEWDREPGLATERNRKRSGNKNIEGRRRELSDRAGNTPET